MAAPWWLWHAATDASGMLDRELQVVVRGLLTNAQCVALQCELIGLPKLTELT